MNNYVNYIYELLILQNIIKIMIKIIQLITLKSKETEEVEGKRLFFDGVS